MRVQLSWGVRNVRLVELADGRVANIVFHVWRVALRYTAECMKVGEGGKAVIHSAVHLRITFSSRVSRHEATIAHTS